MSELENRKAAREARVTAASRTDRHSTAELAESAMRRYFAEEAYRERDDRERHAREHQDV
ncbi:hypothetical protein GCM10027445_29780 [Amycolatopsis endophytica]|uniref:Uncharacterized protein n=1 Tax=Amycolatopsis endophytica TaxID=860233 RepID=A0A853BC27_9PSEU|nr:hypothetical protein [Amycolatopsis endophytica]NYI91926.1 hypothetical protein [Amycolatopsis endophytica]